MLRWIGTNLRTLILAFILALAVWVSAVSSTNPDQTQVFPNPIPIEFIGQNPSLIITGEVPQQVQVTLRAPQSVWNRLTSGEDSIHAIVDLTQRGPGKQAVEVQIQVAAQPVRIISVSPRVINLTLERLLTQTLPVELITRGEPAIGYQIGEATLEPNEAVVSGPESRLRLVKHLQASLDLSNARQGIEADIPITATDEAGLALTGLTIHPDSLAVKISVIQQGGYRDLAVKVITHGRPASGYRLTNVVVFPPIVTVYSSNLTLIGSLPGYVETIPLDLTSANENIEAHLNLNLAPGVTLIGDQSVLVQVGISPIEGSLTMSYRPVEVVGLQSGLQAHLSPAMVDVILSGPLSVLDALLISDVHVQVDVSNLAPGTYQLTPTVEIANQQVTIETILPGTVEVIITSVVTPTP